MIEKCRRRGAEIVCLRFDAPRQMKEILEGIEWISPRGPKVDMADARVHFSGFGASALTVKVYAYILKRTGGFPIARQRLACDTRRYRLRRSIHRVSHRAGSLGGYWNSVLEGRVRSKQLGRSAQGGASFRASRLWA